MSNIPDHKGKTPSQILENPIVADPAWHIFTSLCWIDHAERKNDSTALMYAAIQLRYGIEYLWFTIFFASRGSEFSAEDYKKAVGNATTLYKLIEKLCPHYEKFYQFFSLIRTSDSIKLPPTILWDNHSLKRIHGECSGLLLHFQGVTFEDAFTDVWFIKRIAYLKESALGIWNIMINKGNLLVFNPDKLQKPEVFEMWEEYKTGKIDDHSVKIRFQLIQPILKKRKELES